MSTLTTEGQREGRVRESKNYLWPLDEVIRRETNGTIYKGYQKKPDYELRSIKVLYQCTDENRREFEVLKLLNHENVVKLWATEKDLMSGEVALAMEYCNGSNLLSILDKPENAYGLQEKDFISLLHDLACGMEHLRKSDIVHRNINPKNIIQHQTEDGRCVFKLFDFGTARHLEEGASCQSFYGEIEYQFPGMYESNVTGQNCTRQFQASVDLWSVGVTLFQAATGHLPFRPYGGARQNLKTMFKMTSEKASGCISCSQNKSNGQLIYSSSLPDTCHLSTGLQILLVPLLIALLEPDQEQILTYDTFFRKVEIIVSKLLVYVFNVSECQLLHVYCDRDVCLPEFIALVRQQMATDVGVEAESLHFQDRPISKLLSGNQVISSFPVTSSLDPIFLLPSCSAADDVKKTVLGGKLPKFPEMKEEVEIMNDLSLAKRVCKDLSYLKQTAADLMTRQRLANQAIKKMNFMLQWNLSELENNFHDFGSLQVVEFIDRIHLMLAFVGVFRRMFPENLTSATEFEGRLEHHMKLALEVTEEFSELQSKAKELQIAMNETVISDALNSSLSLGCHDDISHNCEKSIGSRFTIATEITNEFEKKRLSRKMEKDEEERHLFQKKKLRECFSESLKIIHETCFQNLQILFEHATPLFCEYQSRSEAIESVKCNGNQLKEKLSLLMNDVNELMEEMNIHWHGLCKERRIVPLSRLQLLESELFRDFSYHKVVDNRFGFTVSPSVYKQLLTAGVLPSVLPEPSLSSGGCEPQTASSVASHDVQSSSPLQSTTQILLETAYESFTLCDQPETLVD